ncbi:hypothetical protein PSQ39_08625 [Curvibacter sp. HBC28]|uniref:Uncharacterized protein n=1 Tax=Curvibacter microcysteis TaxID=3026419 RepID=A0ABT5MDM4_9BURK|nr:hypothetical protein [Curvibacter sp. HBC28]MDD0814691.1 hypothetical protein [Curvibacter sp. HBC28]
MSAHDQLQLFESQLQQWGQGAISIATLSQTARSQGLLLAALPPQFETVLHQLLDRLESAALITEESCSFSQKDLADHLHGWVAKARQRLS